MVKTLLHELMMQAVSLAVNLCCGTRMCPRTQPSLSLGKHVY
jgi:hypothetical protein